MPPQPPSPTLKAFKRELVELTAELRVAVTGVQVLFAFLLTVPFNQRFADVTGLERVLYFLGLLTAALATVVFLAPSIYHRLHFRRDIADKELMLVTFNQLTIAASCLLAAAVITALAFITSFVFGTRVMVAVCGPVSALLVWLWYGFPLARLRHASSREVLPEP